jgi:hypothetical protein
LDGAVQGSSGQCKAVLEPLVDTRVLTFVRANPGRIRVENNDRVEALASDRACPCCVSAQTACLQGVARHAFYVARSVALVCIWYTSAGVIDVYIHI